MYYIKFALKIVIVSKLHLHTGDDRVWIDLDIGDEVFTTDAFSGVTVDVNSGSSNVYYKPGSNEITAESSKYSKVVCVL